MKKNEEKSQIFGKRREESAMKKPFKKKLLNQEIKKSTIF